MVEVKNLYKFYHTGEVETLALKDVSFKADEGKIIAITGPSGSGKSTLISLLCGLDEPSGGAVFIDGQMMTRKNEPIKADIRAKLGIVIQAKDLIEHLTIKENILLKMSTCRNKDKDRVKQLLDMVGLSNRADFYPTQISGGEIARAALAVALANSPKVIVADEPTGEVDIETEKKLIAVFEDFRANGGTAIIATHSGSLVKIADSIIMLYDGMMRN